MLTAWNDSVTKGTPYEQEERHRRVARVRHAHDVVAGFQEGDHRDGNRSDTAAEHKGVFGAVEGRELLAKDIYRRVIASRINEGIIFITQSFAEIVTKNFGWPNAEVEWLAARDLARGPGLLCQALDIDGFRDLMVGHREISRGGGEGSTTPGRHPVTPWGVPTLGYRTRPKGKASDKLIVRGRRRGKKR